MDKLRIGIVYGGRSVEHEVSIASATSIREALDPSRYELTLIAISQDGRWRLGAPGALPATAVTGEEVTLPAAAHPRVAHALGPDDDHRPGDHRIGSIQVGECTNHFRKEPIEVASTIRNQPGHPGPEACRHPEAVPIRLEPPLRTLWDAIDDVLRRCRLGNGKDSSLDVEES
jgi:hypothetical protein